MDTKRYAVLGAGRQGKAAAYDLAKFGNASVVILADNNTSAATDGAKELNLLLKKDIIVPVTLDATNTKAVRKALQDVNGVVSAMHYKLNLALTKIAINSGCNMVDLGGNTDVVLSQHKLDYLALRAGVLIIPDCGMAPGFDVNLAHYALTQVAHPREVKIYCGGIPERPVPPLGYHFPFAVSGLVNECSGQADVIAGGKVAKRPCLDSIELVRIPAIGMLEASRTSGGLSTAPWTFNRNFRDLEQFEYKTLRWRGHWRILMGLAAKGELESGLEALARTTPHDHDDLGIIEARCEGIDRKGKKITVILDVLDRYDQWTGFTAMQRLTGFHASIMLLMATEKLEGGGVLCVGEIDPNVVIGEFAKRGVVVEKTIAVQE